jgi:hypothetical protein
VRSSTHTRSTSLGASESGEALPRPRHALDAYDQYELGAHTLRDLLATTNDHVRSFLWASGIEGITAALNAARASDPRTAADPIEHLVSRSEESGETESP